jgi:heme/copper-type cytochrome/quinol oxidase subunit 2
MLENATTYLPQNKLLQNVAILVAVIAAIILFTITLNNLGLFRFGSQSGFIIAESDTVIETDSFKFVQQDIRLTAETEVKLALFNTDILPHSFDVDELDLHLAMPANDRVETTLTIAQPGAYAFYCAIPGHREAGMTGTLIIEP